jgi:uncharacterized protein YidB (DUF937 family)
MATGTKAVTASTLIPAPRTHKFILCAENLEAGGIGGLLGQLGLGSASAGGILSGGLGELLERFKQSGQGETAKSWVNTGPNKPCTADQLEQAIGPEVLETLSRQTGLPREELVSRLCRELPDAVDKYTPEGRLPTEAELSRA